VTCREITEFLREFVAGELPADTQREFDAHVARCHDCVVFLDQYKTTILASRAAFDVPDDDVPEELIDAIMKALKGAG
jgi:anti-sigma factor RsiW